MQWPKVADSMIPFCGDVGLRKYYLRYRSARPDEIKRKLEVCRQAILNGHDVDRFTRKQEVLWYIDTRRQARLHRREAVKEALDWLKIPGLVVAAGTAVAMIVKWGIG
jgi:hypothetical protein